MKKIVLLLAVGLMTLGLQAQEKKAEITFETDVIDFICFSLQLKDCYTTK